MLRSIFILVSLATTTALNAQVLNIESKRFQHDTDGWAGRIQLDFAAQQNSNTVYELGNTIHIQYKKGRHRTILLNDIHFSRVNNNSFVNTGYQHLRYNYRLGENSRWTWEAFLQSQYNKPMKLDFRGLAGTGPRYRLIRNEHIRTYLGTLYMFEHEISDGGKNRYDDHRMSSYCSLTWLIGDKADLVNTVYYQPLLTDFSDYRIADEFSFNFEFTKHFGLELVFGTLLDTKQPDGIPEFSWRYRQKLTYRF